MIGNILNHRDVSNILIGTGTMKELKDNLTYRLLMKGLSTNLPIQHIT